MHMPCLSQATDSSYRSCQNGRTCQVWRRAAAVEEAAAVAVVLEAEEALVEDTAHPRCMVVAEEEVDTAAARRWDEVATEAAIVPEVAVTTHTELRIHTKLASPGKTALQRFMRHSHRLANELLDQRCMIPTTQHPTASGGTAAYAGSNDRHRYWTLYYFFDLFETKLSG